MEVASHFVTDEQLKKNYFYENKPYHTVPVIRISEYINKYVATRHIPPGKRGAVVMKLDVEVKLPSRRLNICTTFVDYVKGMEVGIVGDLIMSGALAHLDNIHVDWPKYKLSEEDSNKGPEEIVDVRVDGEIQGFK